MSSDSSTAERSSKVIPVVSEPTQQDASNGVDSLAETDPGQLMRASVYEMLAAMLVEAPSGELISRLAALEPVDTSEGSLAMGWELLRQASLKVEKQATGKQEQQENGDQNSDQDSDRNSSPDSSGQKSQEIQPDGVRATQFDTLTEEYFNLFIGVGRGELVPFGSWYMTGFLMEKPLSLLRKDLAELGIQRQEGVAESEDHIAALCDAMAMLIRSGESLGFERQKIFFNDHLEPWAARFFNDLQNAKGAGFYRAIGYFGESFIEFEQQYFDMQA